MKKLNWKQRIAAVLFASLAFSVVFAAIRLAGAPAEGAGDAHGRVKSDYALMLIQCVMGIVVMLLPSLLEKKWSFGIPNFIYILYYVFLYCAIFLGEVMDFYYRVPHWDSILHFFSGGMLGALGFILVDLLNSSRRVGVNLSPLFISVFAFCFALAAGAVWEIYEYSFDCALGLNMQKYMTADNVAKIGQEALRDTMKDVILDAAAALGVAVLGYFSEKRQRAKEGGGISV